jgi:ABC-type molybdate transport system ATPase subunit
MLKELVRDEAISSERAIASFGQSGAKKTNHVGAVSGFQNSED